MTQRELVLSSSSKARRELLQQLNVAFTCTSPDIDESPKPNERAEDLVVRLAIEKAQASSIKYPEALIIGSDQVGTLEQHIFGKPLTHENAVAQLQQRSGKTVRFFTGLCVLDAKTKRYSTALSTYDVTFRTLTISDIEHYLQKEDALHCAGGLHIEGLGIALTEKLAGDDYTSLIGLPLIQLTQMLAEFGLDVLK